MDVREKLVELIAQKVCDTWSESCDQWLPHDCGKCYANDCHISEIADYLVSNGVTVQDWVSVKERLPQEKVNCIVHYKHAYCDNDDYWAIGMCFYDGEKFQFDPAYKVTHWMPLPEPPKGE